METTNGPPEHNEVEPESPRAAIFLGMVGAREVVELPTFKYLSSPDGSIGIPLDQLSRIATELDGETILWVRPEVSKNGNDGTDTGVESSISSFHDGRVEIDHGRRELIVDGAEQYLTPLEFGVLGVLVENRGNITSRETIVNSVWGKQNGFHIDRSVDVHISHIRGKLGEMGWILKGKKGAGYMFDDRRPKSSPPD